MTGADPGVAAAGCQGSVGAQDVMGPAAVKGEQGPPGPQGPMGQVGPKVEDGARGPVPQSPRLDGGDQDGGSVAADLGLAIRGVADVPVISISGHGQDEVIARAFDAEAGDYVANPFSPTELAAGTRADLRRRAAPAPSEPFALGDLVVNCGQRGTGAVLRAPAQRVQSRGQRRRTVHAHRHEHTPPQAGRRRGQPGLRLRPAEGGLPDGGGA